MSRPPKLITLEIARFLAALAVALGHLSTSIPQWQLGPAPLPPMPTSAAVQFFFTLSGFVIYVAHYQDAGQPARLPHYIWRRVWRIYPLYWLSLLPMLMVLWHGWSLAYLAKIITLAPLTGPVTELNPPAWTLRLELLFYIIFGFSLLPYARRILLPAWGLILIVAWYHDLRGWGGPWLTPGTAAHLLARNNIMFFAGLGAGWVFVRRRPSGRVLWPLLGASLLAQALLLRLDDWGSLYPAAAYRPFAAIVFATVIFTLAALERGGHMRLHRRWAALGAISYPLYLLHSPTAFIFSATFFFHPEDKGAFTALSLFYIMLAISLAVSTFAAFLFDAPLQRLARRVM